MTSLSAWHQLDSAVSTRVFQTLYALGYEEAGRPAHPLTRGKWLVDSPTPLLVALLTYHIIVVVGCLVLNSRKRNSPQRQRNPDPIWLRYGVQFHNVFLVLLSLWMSVTSLHCAFKYKYRFYGQAVSSKETDLGRVAYVFYVSKIYEFVDTVSLQIVRPCQTTFVDKAYSPALEFEQILLMPAVHHAVTWKSRASHIPARVSPCGNKLHLVSILHGSALRITKDHTPHSLCSHSSRRGPANLCHSV